MIRYSVCALLVFTAGFLLFHGREAAHSGLWDYTITHDDEYIYWAIARGSMAAPASDANPFYHEERNLTNPIPSYLTVTAAGRLAAVLDIQVLALLPLWKIPLPFSLWVVFFSAWFACGTIPWELAPPWRCSCCSARSLCTAPRSLPYFAFRARVMVWGCRYLWLSLLAHADEMLATGLAKMAITPYFTILQVWTVGLQCGWEWIVRRDWARVRVHLLVLFILVVCACAYLAYILINTAATFYK